MFRNRNLITLSIPRRCEREGIYTYGELVEEYTKQCLRLPHKKYVANIFPKMTFCDIHGKAQNTIFLSRVQARIALPFVTHKDLYNEIIQHGYSAHHSMEKWELKLSNGNMFGHLSTIPSLRRKSNPSYGNKYTSIFTPRTHITNGTTNRILAPSAQLFPIADSISYLTANWYRTFGEI